MSFKSIMIVDDSESDQFLTRHVINKYDSNIEIFQTFDGQEALDKLTEMEEQPSLILLDINMPRVNGFEFLKEYSKFPEPAAVVSMLTSSLQVEDKDQSMEHDCVKTFFLKPLDADDLKNIQDKLGF